MLQFAREEWLWLLSLIPVLGVLAILVGKRRNRDWRLLGQPGRPESTGSIHWIPAAICLVVALAQPRWGKSQAASATSGHDVVLAIDLSRSMGVEDALPNRLGLATEAAKSLIEALGSETGARVAVVGFAGRGVLRCPLTENLGAAIDAVDALRVGQIEPNGTNLGGAIDASLKAFDEEGGNEGGSIVLFTDGEDHPQTWRDRIERLRDRGVIVHSVAIGDAEQGHVIPDAKAGTKSSPSGSHHYQGKPVLSKRFDEPLDAISGSTGGAVVRLGLSSANLGSIYQTRIEPVADSNRTTLRPSEIEERFSLFLMAAFSFCLAANWSGWTRLISGHSWLPWSLVLAVSLAASPGSGSLRDLVEQGRRAYSTQRIEEALARFQEAKGLAPSDPVVLYNEAAALFQLKRFTEAMDSYQSARAKARPVLQAKIDFALGNTALALQDLSTAIGHYDDCLASTVSGQELDEVRRDAFLNRAYVVERSETSPSITESPTKADTAPPSDESRTSQAEDEAKPEPKAEPQPNSSGGGDRESTRSKTAGGGGGSTPRPRPTTLEDQLDEAVENVKKSRGRRMEESVPPASDGDQKDW